MVIIDEMFKGNFSFLILVISILQLIVMIRNSYVQNKKDKHMKRIKTEKGYTWITERKYKKMNKK